MRKELIAHEDPKSTISEIFRTLRTNIQFMNNRNKLQTLLITSTLPREGKSWTSANLAVTFAQAGNKVILVDADMRKGRQYAIFGLPPKPGLSNYLADFNANEGNLRLSEYIKETEVDGLYLMPAGNVPPNPSELLISGAMIHLLEQLKQLSDIVILDGPPTQLVTDSLILARMADTTVVVTASNQTKKDDLRRIVDNIQKVGGKMAGIVVNKIPISSKKYEQAYYYGASTSLGEPKNKNKKMPSVNKKKMPSIMNQSGYDADDIKDIEQQELTQPEIQPDIQPEIQPDTQPEPESNTNLQQEVPAEVEQTQGVSFEKANDILKQINEYIDQEKKNLDE